MIGTLQQVYEDMEHGVIDINCRQRLGGLRHDQRR